MQSPWPVPVQTGIGESTKYLFLSRYHYYEFNFYPGPPIPAVLLNEDPLFFTGRIREIPGRRRHPGKTGGAGKPGKL